VTSATDKAARGACLKRVGASWHLDHVEHAARFRLIYVILTINLNAYSAGQHEENPLAAAGSLSICWESPYKDCAEFQDVLVPHRANQLAGCQLELIDCHIQSSMSGSFLLIPSTTRCSGGARSFA
jgi:hypothetical protein